MHEPRFLSGINFCSDFIKPPFVHLTWVGKSSFKAFVHEYTYIGRKNKNKAEKKEEGRVDCTMRENDVKEDMEECKLWSLCVTLFKSDFEYHVIIKTWFCCFSQSSNQLSLSSSLSRILQDTCGLSSFAKTKTFQARANKPGKTELLTYQLFFLCVLSHHHYSHLTIGLFNKFTLSSQCVVLFS